MGRLTGQGRVHTATQHLFFQAKRLAWTAGRYRRSFTRHFGAWGWAIGLLSILGVVAGIATQQQAAEIGVLDSRLAERLREQAVLAVAPTIEPEDGRTRLLAFEQHLLPHGEIPAVVQSLLQLANEEGLSISHAEYRVHPEPAGGFLRYRMTFPAQGESRAIYRFIRRALRTQPMLALESIRFKREHIESSDIEAQIQWAVLAQLPVGTKAASGRQENPGDKP